MGLALVRKPKTASQRRCGWPTANANSMHSAMNALPATLGPAMPMTLRPSLKASINPLLGSPASK